ncbi:MAG: peptide-methionine (R)-S-oxide reductase MsrB [Metallibacterium scheffleri]|jgi:methionine-R-sulfoxide reductase
MNDTSKQTPADAHWRARLSPEQYAVCRCSVTEAPFSGRWYRHHADGTYVCIACAAPLFDSAAKYDSGSGWPSFWQPIAATAVSESEDTSHDMHRVEARCTSCGSHLGHVFPDGPPPTGLRYCINSLALDFVARDVAGKRR